MNHKIVQTIALMLVSSVALTACPGTSVAPNPQPSPQPAPGGTPTTPQPTAVGKPVGPRTTATIGSEGGILESVDGKAKLEVPAGALATPTEISVQPIQNTVLAGIGTAYRFLPNSLEFARPATVTLEYEGDNPKLARLMVQQADGLWASPAKQTQSAVTAQAEQGKKNISARLKRLADLANASRFYLEPERADVLVGQSLSISAYDSLPDCQKLDCSDQPSDKLVIPAARTPIREVYIWKINDSIIGSDTYGTVNGPLPFSTVTYTAPAQVPAKNPVLVTADILLDKWADPGEVFLNSNITIRLDGHARG